MRIRKTLLMVVLASAAATTAWAQQPAEPAEEEATKRVEVSLNAGWTFSDGVTGGPIIIPTVGAFERIDPNNAFAWGGRLAIMVTDSLEAGALYDQQGTNLNVLGTEVVTVGDLMIRNYHGYIGYNFGSKKLRPYLFGGAGMTQFGSVTTDRGNTLSGNSKFSTTWGLGAKFFTGARFGLKVEGRWTPTYIKSDAAGWWCDPYYGCYLVSDSQYSNQWQMAGGIILRF